MITSMAFFAVEDSLIKFVTSTIPIGQILIMFGLGGALIFLLVAHFKNEKIMLRDMLLLPMYVRALFEIIGRLFYVLAISLIPLSTATVIIQATPIVVVAGAAIIFGEKVGWRRWTAILLGLFGVIVIIQPTAESFSFLSILALIGMIGFAGRDLASRAAPENLSVFILGLHGFIALAFSGLIYTIWDDANFVMIDIDTIGFMVGAVVFGVAAYSCLMKAMRTGEVSAVTPFRYTRLIFGVSLGVFFFNESLNYSTVLGTILIVISGLFILSRNKRE
ncbi:MAG: DMT family transporter [Amylibacter sp.]|jgi:drug/metabolite transporter (DMT)-like permease|tara:strand:- start:350 stop:1180 length:831 start_codon:yes stop_codon:yes gene_type:complete